MNKFVTAVFEAELLKICKSKMLWISIISICFAPFISGLFMFILKNPDMARTSGLLNSKAQLQGSADWPTYLQMIAQIIAIGGLVLFGFITSWIFGREYSDRTVKDLLALPVRRTSIVIAKFMAILCWSGMLILLVVAGSLLVGWCLGLPLWSAQSASHGIFLILKAALLVVVLVTPVGFFASLGRGFLAPLGFIVATIIVSQVIDMLGYGAYFPWAVPSLLSGAAGPDYMVLNPVSYVVVLATGAAGLIGSLAWWRLADQH